MSGCPWAVLGQGCMKGWCGRGQLQVSPAPQGERLQRGRPSYMVKGHGIGDFGGGELEHPRQWLGAQRADLFQGVLTAGHALRRHWNRVGALPPGTP